MGLERSGHLGGVEISQAIDAEDLEQHLRTVRAASADLRTQLERMRARIEAADAERRRQDDLAREAGTRVLALERELAQARREVCARIEAIDAAADEEVAEILGSAHQEADRLHAALEAAVQSGEAPAVVLRAPRGAGVRAAEDRLPRRAGDERSVATL